MNSVDNKTLVVIPTYNESENIDSFIRQFNDVDVDILIVDDNSPDGTGHIVSNLTEEINRIHLLSRSKKQGLGSAYREGFSWGINKGYKYLIEMDADFSHRIDDLKIMLKQKSEYDVVIGSRYVSGGGSTGWSIRRKLLSRGANIFAATLLLSKVNDLTSGFRIYKASSLEAIFYETTSSNGYSFQIEMTIRCLSKGLSILEVPIVFEERREGNSKMDSSIALEAVLLIFKLSIKRILRREVL